MEDESLFFSVIERTTVVEELVVAIQTNHNIIQQISPDIETTEETIQLTTHDSGLTTKVKRELPKTSTMGSMFKEIHKEVVSVKDENKTELTEENTQTIWKDFLSENKDKLQNAFLSAAQNQIPKLIEDKVTFIASNNVSLEMLQLHKMDITTYFRKRTTSTTVTPHFVLQRDESHVKNYKTAKDRLKDMIDSNGAVLKLIEKFDLNID